MLLSDKVLDDCRYYNESEEGDYSWEGSAIRIFLNGYDVPAERKQTNNLNRCSFFDTAFEQDSRDSILNTTIVPSDLINNASGDTRKNTVDKIFLLVDAEVYETEQAKIYGFNVKDENDEAKQCKSSSFAKAMGMWWETYGSEYLGNCRWWLRYPPYLSIYTMDICETGARNELQVLSSDDGVRPALQLNLSDERSYSYAGIVCSDGTVKESSPGEGHTEASSSIESMTSKLTLEIGQIAFVEYSISNGSSSGVIAWTSSNPVVAVVDSAGAVKGMAVGTTIITATLGDTVKKCELTIIGNEEAEEKVKIKSVTLARDRITLKVNENFQLDAVIAPSNATNRELKWTSSNPDVIYVDSNGKITAFKEGSAFIVACAKDGSNASAFCYVKAEQEEVKATGIRLDKTSYALTLNKTAQIKAEVLPANATNKKLKYTSKNTSCVKVSENGKMTAVGVGTAKIIAETKDGTGIQKTVTVTVKYPSASLKLSGKKTVMIKKSVKMTASKSKNLKGYSVKWKILSGKKYVSLDKKTGNAVTIRGKKKGTATVGVSCGWLEKKIRVKVTDAPKTSPKSSKNETKSKNTVQLYVISSMGIDGENGRYTYNSYGLLEKEEYAYSYEGEEKTYKKRVSYTYTKSGRYKGSQCRVREYLGGKMTDEYTDIYSYKYNKKGQLVLKRKEMKEEGGRGRDVTYEYDDKGRCIKCDALMEYNKDDVLVKLKTWYSTSKYSYDSNGYLKGLIYYGDTGEKGGPIWTEKYKNTLQDKKLVKTKKIVIDRNGKKELRGTYKFTYKKITVPKKYLKKIEAQQRYFLMLKPFCGMEAF